MEVAQSCPTLCDPMDYTVHGILQARILEWVAFPFSRGSSEPWSPTLQTDSSPAESQGKTTMGYYSAIRNEFDSVPGPWLNLEPLRQSEEVRKTNIVFGASIWYLGKWYQ